MIIWILGDLCSNQGLIVIIMLKCYLNGLGVEYYWTCFIYKFLLYISMFMVSLPLFVCVFVVCAMIV